jgi:hypothetical protein
MELRFNTLNGGPGRTLLLEAVEEVEKRLAGAFHFYIDPLRGVIHPPAQAHLACEPVNERPEPDALHGPRDANCHALSNL